MPGTQVLFCRWETRVPNWQRFIQEEGDAETLTWRRLASIPSWVNCEEPRRFCTWLSKKEGRNYRLPTNA